MIKQTFWRFTTPVITIEVGSPSLCKDICATKCIVMNLKVTFLGLKDIEIKSYSLGKKTQNTHSKTKPNQKNPPQDKETNKKNPEQPPPTYSECLFLLLPKLGKNYITVIFIFAS